MPLFHDIQTFIKPFLPDARRQEALLRQAFFDTPTIPDTMAYGDDADTFATHLLTRLIQHGNVGDQHSATVLLNQIALFVGPDQQAKIDGFNQRIANGELAPPATDLATKPPQHPIFISYARRDGRDIATRLRNELISRGYNLWQDVVSMEAGEKWWTQIKEAIEQSAVMVLVLTDGSLKSKVVGDEWAYARTVGTAILPVTHDDAIFSKAPKWISDRDVCILRDDHPDILQTRQRYYRFLDNPPERQPRPYTVPNLPEHFVNRPREFDALRDLLLSADQLTPVAITTALHGGGGFGKTTLAIALGRDERVRVAFDDGIVFVTLGETPDTLGLINSLVRLLKPGTLPESDINTAAAMLENLLKDRAILMILDDVWNDAHITSLTRCKDTTYLITTRLQEVVSRSRAKRVLVNEMQTDEAAALLVKWLDETPTDAETTALRDLAKRLGEWPLLLELVGAELRELVMLDELPLAEAITEINTLLDDEGFTGLDKAADLNDENQRNRAASISLDVSLRRLKDDLPRFLELGIFPEDTNIAFATVAQLWSQTANLNDGQTRRKLREMNRLSLFTRYDASLQTLRLHDVIRQILLARLPDPIATHAALITAWGDLTQLPDDYAWRNVAHHLQGAAQTDTLRDLLFNLDYLQNKLNATDTVALLDDADVLPDDAAVQLVKSAVSISAHLLSEYKEQIGVQLYACLMSYRDEHAPIARLLDALPESPHANLLPLHQTLPPAGGALIRTLTGHTSYVNGVVMQGDVAISASWDETLKVWHWPTGEMLRTLEGHTDAVYGVAMQGDIAISASNDDTLRVWHWQSGELLRTLKGHTDEVKGVAMQGDVAISASGSISIFGDNTLKVWHWPTGELLRTLTGHTYEVWGVTMQGDVAISASWDNTLKVWHWQTGELRHTLTGHTRAVNGVAMQGDVAISASWDNTLKVWHWQSGEMLRTLVGHTSAVNGVAMQGDVAISASEDDTLKVWHWPTGEVQRTLEGHTDAVNGVAMQGDVAISASDDNTLKVWHWQTGELRHTLTGHTRAVNGVAMQGDIAISASYDHTLKVWHWQSGELLRTLTGHTDRVFAVAMQGDIAISASSDKTLKVWHWHTGEILRTLVGHTYYVTGVAIQGDIAISASGDETLKVWHWHTGEILRTLTGHTSWVNGVAMQGDIAISASNDDTLKVWHWPTERCLCTFTTDSRQYAVVIAPDASGIVSGGTSGRVHFFRPSAALLRLLRGEG